MGMGLLTSREGNEEAAPIKAPPVAGQLPILPMKVKQNRAVPDG
jgi:hypothetical protein